MVSRAHLAGLLSIVGALALPAAANANPPIWEPNFGATIPAITDDDDVATDIPMGTFAFPFYGVTHTGAETFGVSSNGLVVIGGPGDTSNGPNGNDARVGPGKVAALWADLNPDDQNGAADPPDFGSVYQNTFNDDGDAAIDRVVFTWDAPFFGCEDSPTCRELAQVQLLESGRIIFGYNGVLTNQAFDQYGQGQNGLMPLVAKGGFVNPVPPAPAAPPATGIGYSEAVPFTGNDLIFEFFSGRALHFDLDQSNLIFDPVGATGFSVSSPTDIAVTTTASTPTVATGGTVTYTSTVTNTGSTAVDDVTLTDRLPNGGVAASANASQGSCAGSGPVNCLLGSLAPGASATVTVGVGFSLPGSVTNRVDVATSTPGDGHSNNTTQQSTTVTADATAPTATIALDGKQSPGGAASKGVKVKFSCDGACFGEITVTSKTDKLGTIGTADGELAAAGSATVTVPLSKAARKAFEDADKAKLKLSLIASDEAGNQTTAKKGAKLK
jgi:uncharacterized repeat protein (TIGR01451 family)